MVSDRRKLLRRDGKCGKGSAVSEREQRFLAHRIEVAVANVDPLPVTGIIRIPEIADCAVILPCCPCSRELSRRVLLPEQDLRQNGTGRRAEL